MTPRFAVNGWHKNGHTSTLDVLAPTSIDREELREHLRPQLISAFEAGFAKAAMLLKAENPDMSGNGSAHSALMLALVDAEIAAREGSHAAPERIRALTSLIGETRKLATAIGQDASGETVEVKAFVKAGNSGGISTDDIMALASEISEEIGETK